MIYQAFDKQAAFHHSGSRIRGVFCGKRSGKTECGAIESIIWTEQQRNWNRGDVDSYAGAIIAPTTDMLRRLSMKKFLAYAKPFKFRHHQTYNEIEWHNGSMVYGISGDKPQRLEGLKLNWIWIDEVFQCSEQLFLETRARVADQRGSIWVTGSLGVQYQNPRRHWVYKYFKEKKAESVDTFEWTTADNPYFPRDELLELKDTLDPRTFRQMFEIDWNTPGSALVYDNFSELNYIKGFVIDPSRHEVSVTIDWGWNHELACLFIAYDVQRDTVTVFDEIISSRMTLDQLYARIMAKQYPISNWFCDIAGNQEREQTGKSNVQWFREKGIKMRYRQTAVNFGVALVRTYIKTGSGIIKLYIDELRCPKTIDGMLNYSYPTKDGQIVNENPLKVADDAMDSLRYYFVNRLDKAIQQTEVKQFNRWGEWKF